MPLWLRVTRHLLDYTFPWSLHRYYKVGGSGCFTFLFKAQQPFQTKTIYRACFQMGCHASHVSQLSTPWERLGFNLFPKKRVWRSLFSSHIQSVVSFGHTAATFSCCPCPPQTYPHYPPHWRRFTWGFCGYHPEAQSTSLEATAEMLLACGPSSSLTHWCHSVCHRTSVTTDEFNTSFDF